jgi:hypothetical protein
VNCRTVKPPLLLTWSKPPWARRSRASRIAAYGTCPVFATRLNSEIRSPLPNSRAAASPGYDKCTRNLGRDVGLDEFRWRLGRDRIPVASTYRTVPLNSSLYACQTHAQPVDCWPCQPDGGQFYSSRRYACRSVLLTFAGRLLVSRRSARRCGSQCMHGTRALRALPPEEAEVVVPSGCDRGIGDVG